MNSPADIWARVLSLMEADMTATTIHTWFDDTEAVALEEDRFVLYTPSDFKKDIIAARYLGAVKKALHELFSAEFDVLVLGPGEMEQRRARQKKDDNFLPGTEEYTFERFVVGSSNKFAHAAARAVADHPAQNYNPLFIYGESGLGKTHLLYAIAHTIHNNHPDYRIVYIKGDAFTNELIHAIREGRNQEFREKYRGADIFLMPSISEPCGLSQMIAMRYGAVPIVRETGGLKDTVHAYEAWNGQGNGFTFANYNAGDMCYVICEAIDLYHNNKDAYAALQKRGMTADFSWTRSAQEYRRIYESICR